MTAQEEVDFLERLYLLEGVEEQMTSKNKLADDPQIRRLADRAIAEQVRVNAADGARVGKSIFNACFFCGTDRDPVAPCGCDFPESFRCVGQRVCAGCGEAHRSLANTLTELFATKLSMRVDSVRKSRCDALLDGALALESPSVSGSSGLAEGLSADPFDDGDAEFRSKTLNAFRNATNFFAYRQLVKVLKTRSKKNFARALRRMLILQ